MRCRPLLPYTALVSACLLASCSSDPTAPRSGVWAHVSAGEQFSCGLTAAGAAYCWGAGSFGQLGSLHTLGELRPVAVAGAHVFTSISAGNDHVCALSADGSAWCWGLDDYLELGAPAGRCNGALPVDCASRPLRVLGAPPFDSITVAGYATCGLSSDHLAWCWGWNHHGQVGSGNVSDIVDHPTAVGGGRLFNSLSLDLDHACGATPNQFVYCWGSNVYGQLGADSSALARCGAGAGFFCAIAPVAAAGGLALTSVSAGSTATCAIGAGGASTGTWCWGSNEYGVLGNPIAGSGPLPSAALSGLPLVQVSSGHNHVCGLDASGGAWCWGVNDYLQVGAAQSSSACTAFGSAQPCETIPVAVSGVPALAEISAGTFHTCAVSRAGEIWCWGRNTFGQLGDSRTGVSELPVRVVDP